jgi:hypothetical protein
MRFALSRTPDLGVELAVFVDGQRLEALGPSGDKRWDYDSASNAIVFEALAAPDPGSTVNVSYWWVACR